MTYQPNIPTDLPSPSVAVAFIQANFSQFATLFALNHEAINTSNQGKHDAVIMQSQTNDPGVTGDYDALYCKAFHNVNISSEMLYLQIPQFLPNGQPNLPQQLTYNQVNTTGPVYQSFLFGGYILYFGSVTSTPAVVTLSPAPTSILCAIAFCNSTASGLASGSAIPTAVQVNSATQFTITNPTPQTGVNVSWLAIAAE